MDATQIKQNSETDNEKIHSLLRQYNRQYFANLHDYSFHIDDKQGNMIAGIVAGSTYSTLEIEFLYVVEEHRNQGLGETLIKYVEDKAKQDGIKFILLNTYSFQAPLFYKKLGYKELFKIDPCFSEHKQYYFIKYLNE